MPPLMELAKLYSFPFVAISHARFIILIHLEMNVDKNSVSVVDTLFVVIRNMY